MDNLTPAQRRKNMQNIRSKDTAPEKIVAAKLKAMGLHFLRHDSSLPGTPDFVLPGKKLILFVDSDFWHGRKGHYTLPKTNRKYWRAKIEGNRKRDERVRRKLRRMGWSVYGIWESDVKKGKAGRVPATKARLRRGTLRALVNEVLDHSKPRIPP